MADARANIRLARSTSNEHGPCDDLMKARPKLGLPCKQALLGRPTEFTHPTGPLRKNGPNYLRWALIEAAHTAGRDSRYRPIVERMRARHGRARSSKIAAIEIARRQ